MQHLAVKVYIDNPELTKLEVAQATAVQQADNESVAQQFRCSKHGFDLLCAKYDRLLFGLFDTGKDDSAFRFLVDAVQVSEPVHSVFEKAVRWGFVLLFKEVQVVKDAVVIQVEQVTLEM
jgi:hypothetical protein